MKNFWRNLKVLFWAMCIVVLGFVVYFAIIALTIIAVIGLLAVILKAFLYSESGNSEDQNTTKQPGEN